MVKFTTNLEKKLWEMLYKSQLTLGIKYLEEKNKNRENENDWPIGQKWSELSGSSKAIFLKIAREKSGINHIDYLNILRSSDGLEIAEKLYDGFNIED